MKLVFPLIAVVAGLSWAHAADKPEPPQGGPRIEHIPVTTVLRGQPAHIVANIHAETGSTITLVRVLTRATDVGTPVPYKMSGGPGDGAYATEVPWSAISGLPRFWYHIEVRDSLGRINSTIWLPVNIIDIPLEEGAGGSALLAPKTLKVLGGAALVGGVVAVGENNDWFKKRHDDSSTTPEPPAPEVNKDPVRKDKPVLNPCDPGAPPATVTLDPLTLSPFDNATPIQAKVCGACSNSTIRVVTSWGFNGTSPVTDLLGCKGGAVFSIYKPTSVPNANAEWLQFFDGANLIYSTAWPDPSLLLLGAPPAP